MLYSFKKIEEMRITIEDLEALKELNNELEENHMETAKQLHENLGLLRRCLSSHILLTANLCIDRRSGSALLSSTTFNPSSFFEVLTYFAK
jgi:hypothetical protein